MTDFRETPGTPEDVAARLREPLVSDGFASGAIVAGQLAERLIRDRIDAETVINDQRATIERLERVVAAARGIKHWHDAMPDGSGMVVSAVHVRALWDALRDLDAALSPTTASATTGEVGRDG